MSSFQIAINRCLNCLKKYKKNRCILDRGFLNVLFRVIKMVCILYYAMKKKINFLLICLPNCMILLWTFLHGNRGEKKKEAKNGSGMYIVQPPPKLKMFRQRKEKTFLSNSWSYFFCCFLFGSISITYILKTINLNAAQFGIA